MKVAFICFMGFDENLILNVLKMQPARHYDLWVATWRNGILHDNNNHIMRLVKWWMTRVCVWSIPEPALASVPEYERTICSADELPSLGFLIVRKYCVDKRTIGVDKQGDICIHSSALACIVRCHFHSIEGRSKKKCFVFKCTWTWAHLNKCKQHQTFTRKPASNPAPTIRNIQETIQTFQQSNHSKTWLKDWRRHVR